MKRKKTKNKLDKINALLTDPFIARHVPETMEYEPENLWKMLRKHLVVYVKPVKGHMGLGIIRVKKLSDARYEIISDNYQQHVRATQLVSELRALLGDTAYFLQQGIDLATYRNCPFDIRMVLQKPNKVWRLTLTSAKVAQREDAVVTNVARGAKDYPLQDILQKYDQRQNPLVTIRELGDLSHQIARVLGRAFPLKIIGLDMALDKKGKIWFLEGNNQPQCARCKLVNDKLSQEKYEEARRWLQEKKGP